ncbi:hypothetical protein [Anaeromassilibacillus sp. SJQ-5]
MKEQTYTQFIQEAIDSFQSGEPILIRELGNRIADAYHMEKKKACAAAAVAVKRLIDTGTCPNLRFFAKGVYYVAKQTVFGETGINKDKLIELKYLKDGTGYETGAAVMHKLGLTTLMPAERTFVSNSAQHRAKRDDALGIVIRAPRIPVNKENRFYLQFLDLLNMYDDVPVDAEDPYLLLGRFVQARGLDYGTLLHLADTHYNGNTIMKLAHVAGRQGV